MRSTQDIREILKTFFATDISTKDFSFHKSRQWFLIILRAFGIYICYLEIKNLDFS